MDAPRIVGAAAISAELATLATRLASLEDVVRPELMIVDVVVQDEYTHDVVVAHGAGAVHLVYDST